jgi:hypothetical protein
MSTSDKRVITVVTACMRRDGKPTFARTEVGVTTEEAENGVHYYLVEADLLAAGYEEPMVHFSEDESPSFLFPAVEQFLGVAPEPTILTFSEKT